MKAIVFIGTQKSGSSRDAIKAAERLGFYTVLLTDRPSFIEKRTEFPDAHLMQLCNLDDLDEIRNAIHALFLRAIQVYAIVSFTDPYCHTASLLAEEFGVSHFTTKAMANMNNKIDSRKILSNSPYSPYFFEISEDFVISEDELKKRLPLIIKSPNSMGSKDVLKVTSYMEYKQSVEILRERYPGEPILAEEFLDGPQYLVETLFFENELHIIAIFEQEITFYQRFIVTGYNLMLDPPTAFYEPLREAVDSIVRSHGLECGPCHLEMRFVKNQWKLIEINPRISGAGMNNMIEAAFGINLVEETLKLAMGQGPDLTPKHRYHLFSKYLTVSETGILEKVTGRSKALNCNGVKYVYIKPKKGAKLTPPLSMGNRYAYVIATGDSEETAKENARYAASQIKFWLITTEPEDRGIPTLVDVEIKLDPLSSKLDRMRIYMVEDGKSESTVTTCLIHLNEYLKWFNEYYGREASSLKKESLIEYIDYLRDIKKNSPSTIKRKLSSLAKLNKFLAEDGLQTNLCTEEKFFINDLIENSTDKIHKYFTDSVDY